MSNALAMRGECLMKLMRYEEAEEVMLSAEELLLQRIERYVTKYGEKNKSTSYAIEELIALYDTWNKPDKAAEWRAKLPTTQPATNAVEDGPTTNG